MEAGFQKRAASRSGLLWQLKRGDSRASSHELLSRALGESQHALSSEGAVCRNQAHYFAGGRGGLYHALDRRNFRAIQFAWIGWASCSRSTFRESLDDINL